MMTGAIGRGLRFAAMAAVAGLVVGCAASEGPGAVTAPAGFGKDAASRVARLVQYCDRLAEKGELVTALGLCARAHEIDPAAAEPLMKLAEVLEAMNRREAAVETYAALLERHPRHHEGQYRLGKLYMELGEPALAAVQFDRATHSDAKDPRPYNALGILRDQAGEHEAAQALYRSVLERDPTNLSVRNNLGLSLALNGKRAEAIELLAELAVDPDAGSTVLRNLEAAYAARMPQPGGEAGGEPSAAPSAEPWADPLAPVTSEPLAGAAAVSPLTAPNARPDTQVEAPADGSPTPLFVPPTAGAGEPQQSGALESGSPESGWGEVGASVILSAAERLMQAPDWADFEPGVLIPEIPVPEIAVPVTTTTPPPSDTVDDAEFMETQLEGGKDGASQLALLLLETTAAVA